MTHNKAELVLSHRRARRHEKAVCGNKRLPAFKWCNSHSGTKLTFTRYTIISFMQKLFLPSSCEATCVLCAITNKDWLPVNSFFFTLSTDEQVYGTLCVLAGLVSPSMTATTAASVKHSKQTTRRNWTPAIDLLGVGFRFKVSVCLKIFLIDGILHAGAYNLHSETPPR